MMLFDDIDEGAAQPPFVVSDRKGFWIPLWIWEHHELAIHDKLLLADVVNMTAGGNIYFKSNARIAADLGCSTATVKRSLATLKEHGLLTYDDVGQNNVRVLKCPGVAQNEPAQNDPVGGSKRSRPRVKKTPTPDQNEPHKSKENSTDKNTLKSTDVVLPFASDAFAQAWREWLDERTQRKNKKYTPRGEQGALHNLQKISNSDERTAIGIIQQSIVQGWQGLFPLRNTATAKPVDTDELKAYIRNGSF